MSEDSRMSDRPVRTLSELPRELTPPHDLWSRIEREIAPPVRRLRPLHSPWPVAFAAAIAGAFVLGVWIDRELRPAQNPALPSVLDPRLQPTAFLDARDVRARARLLEALPAALAKLPPDSRAKVLASIATINRSLGDIQAALGRDPDNALLQQLLVDTFTDEMRVLSTVQDTSMSMQDTQIRSES